jgi:hypothetical protein
VEKTEAEGFAPVSIDASNTTSVENAFIEVREKLGAAPGVVVFNGRFATWDEDRHIGISRQL